MPLIKREGIVIKTRKLGEADKILVIFSPQEGRFECVAKGARRARGRFGGRIEPFTRAKFLLYQGRSLPIVTQVEVKESFRKLREDLRILGIGLEALRIINEVSLPQRERELYLLFLNFLRELEKEPERGELLLASFEIKLLTLLGYGPSFNLCVLCGKEAKGKERFFSFKRGGILCDGCQGSDSEGFYIGNTRVLSELLSAPFSELSLSLSSEKEIEEALAFLEHCFSYFLDLELRSFRKDFRDL